MKSIRHLLHYFFVPSQHNNYRAKVIQHDLLGIYFGLIILFAITIRQAGATSNIGQVLGVATNISIQKLYDLTNQERVKNGLNPLKYNYRLADAASHKADNMFAENYWAHFAPSGKTPWDFILAADYQYEYAGENLAKNFLYSNNVVDAWMNSPTHRENILRPEFTEVGYAIKNGSLNGEQTTLVVQMFAKPLAGLENSQQSEPPLTVNQPAVENTGKVLSEVQKPQPKPAPAHTPPYTLVYLFIGFLVIAFAIDFYVAARLNVIRFHGKSMAHLIFLLIIGVGVILFLSKGSIL